MLSHCRLRRGVLGSLAPVFCALSLGASLALADGIPPMKWLICVGDVGGQMCLFEDRGIKAFGVGALCCRTMQCVNTCFEPSRLGNAGLAALLACLAVAERAVAISKDSTIRQNVFQSLAGVQRSGMAWTVNGNVSAATLMAETSSNKSPLARSSLCACGLS